MVKYRYDIDGLRGIAVLSVVLYHAGVSPFSGGFVGVDIFFVISGYLITGLIVSDMNADRFSLVRFYERRIRRIFPALFVLMLFCGVAGWLLITPDDYKRLGLSIVATSLFVSNVLFWFQSGYFDTDAAEKPLLHTWSLAVEEQFYVFFPLYLMILTRWLPKYRTSITMAICLLSLLLSAIAVFFKPSATFYLAPTRAWELLIGSLLALDIVPVVKTTTYRNVAAFAGVGLILIAIFAYTKETMFPGMAALLPAVGTALIIWNTGTFISTMLSTAPIVFVGTISYSLYLWHWPLLAFGSYLKIVGLAVGEVAGLLGVAAVAAVVSWKYIEQPVRSSSSPFLKSPRIFAISTALISVFCAYGAATEFSMWPVGRTDTNKYSATIMSYPQCLYDTFGGINNSSCRLGGGDRPPEFVLWGDSHAQALRAGIDEITRQKNISGILIGAYNCPALLGVDNSLNRSCRAINDRIIDFLLTTPSIQTIILAGMWGRYAEVTRYKDPHPYDVLSVDGHPERRNWQSLPTLIEENHAALETGLERTIATLKAAGRRVWIVGPVPEIEYNVPKALFVQALGVYRDLPIRPEFQEFRDRQRFVMTLFDKVSKQFSVNVVWPHKALCTSALCDIERDGKSLYFDNNHLSDFGAKSISAIYEPIFY